MYFVEATEVSASMADIEARDSLIIQELAPGHVTPQAFEEWCRSKATAEGLDPVDVAFDYAKSVIG